MQQKPTLQRFLAVSILGALLTILFVFVGAPILRVVRNVYGRTMYWGAGVVFAGAVFGISTSVSFLLAAIWVTVGIYGEFEEKGRASFGSALLSVGFGSMLLLGTSYAKEFNDSLKNFAQQMGNNMWPAQTSLDLIQGLMPSILILVVVLSLAFALMLDRKVGALLGLRFERIASSMKLYDFRLSDLMIWVTMISFLLSFIQLKEVEAFRVISLNVFIIMMGLYFLQGLAVTEVALLVWKVGPIFKFLFYFLVVGQLFFLLSFVGIIDYWMDLRERIRRFKSQSKST